MSIVMVKFGLHSPPLLPKKINMLKQKTYNVCIATLKNKIGVFSEALNELSGAASNDSKSTAGDKHETANAMQHIEQEKIGKQLKEAEEQLAVLEKIDITLQSSKVIKGSLIKTNKGYLFLGVGLGKIMVEKEMVITLSAQSPLGAKLLGLKAKEKTEMNGVEYIIQAIY